MLPGFIPDSEPGAPVLDAQDPQWRALVGENRDGARAEASLPLLSSPPRTRVPTTGVEPIAAPAIPRSLMPPESPSETVYLPLATPQDALSSAHPTEPAALELPRRQRFNFEEWVAAEKKTHEIVYHRKLKVFHGAQSDSEDSDFELESTALAESQARAAAASALAAASSSSASEDEEASGSSDEGPTDDPSRAIPNAVLARRRRRVVDSSDSETSETGSPAPLVPRVFRQRLHASIPASKGAQPEPAAENDSPSLPDSLPEFLQTPAEARDAPAPIDYMLSRASGSRPTRAGRSRATASVARRAARPRSIQDVVDELGPTAPLALRVAARTARRTATRAPTAAAAPKTTVRRPAPVKLFRGPFARSAQRTMRRWRRGEVLMPSKETAAAGTDEHSPEADANVGGNRAGVGPTVRNMGTPAGRLPRHEKRRKPRKRRYEPSPDLFHTVVLERQIGATAKRARSQPAPFGGGASPDLRAFGRSSQSMPAASPPPVLATPSSSMRLNAETIAAAVALPVTARTVGDAEDSSPLFVPHVDMAMPRTAIDLSRMSSATFTGSNAFDLISVPQPFNGVRRAEAAFAPAIAHASATRIHEDAQRILALCTGRQLLTDDVYAQLYDYFLVACGHLCDESQIVDARFRWHVMREWVRVAQAALRASERAPPLALLAAEVCALAVLVLSRRVCTLGDKAHTKTNQLAMWTVYCHQQAIAAQIDDAQDERRVPGVELVHALRHFRVLAGLPRVLVRAAPLPAWHMLVVLTAERSRGGHAWYDWDAARAAARLDPAAAAASALILILRWNWPPSADLVFDLFDFYARQQHYADPEGERIWLPKYLLRTQFDGKLLPSQVFLQFLELLGCTLRALCSNDVSKCRRIAGRVTPLSALRFPETSAVSTADLSAATHQYGILMVLLRCMPAGNKPSVSQFRDLVVLRSAHLAIRVKAASAWCIVAQCVEGPERVECSHWMNADILGEDPPESLVGAAVKCAIEVIDAGMADAVPTARIAVLGFQSRYQQLKTSVWRMLRNLPPADLFNIMKQVMRGTSTHAPWGPVDLEIYMDLCSKVPLLAPLWDQLASRPALFRALVDKGVMPAHDPNVVVASVLALLNSVNSFAEESTRSGNEAGPNSGDRTELGRSDHSDVNSSANVDDNFELRLTELLSETTQETCAAILEGIKESMHAGVRLDLISRTRSLIFELYPELAPSNQWLDSRELVAKELTKENIARCIKVPCAAVEFAESEYFFAYKLRESLGRDGGTSFREDMAHALHFASPGRTRAAAAFVFDELLAQYTHVAVAAELSALAAAVPMFADLAGDFIARVARAGRLTAALLTPELFRGFIQSMCAYATAALPDVPERLQTSLFSFAAAWLGLAMEAPTPPRAETVYTLYTLGYRLHSVQAMGLVRPEVSEEERQRAQTRKFKYAFDTSAVVNALRPVVAPALSMPRLAKPVGKQALIDAYMGLAVLFESAQAPFHAEPRRVDVSGNADLLAPPCDARNVYNPA